MSRWPAVIAASLAFGLATAWAGVPMAERAKQVASHLQASLHQKLPGGFTMTSAKAVEDRVVITVQTPHGTVTAAEANQIKNDFPARVCGKSTLVNRHAAAGGNIHFRFETPSNRELITLVLSKYNCQPAPVSPEHSAQTAKAALERLQAQVGPGKPFSRVSLRGEREIVMEMPIASVDTREKAEKIAADRIRLKDAKLKTVEGICEGPVNDVFRIAMEEGVILTMQYFGAGLQLGEFSMERSDCGGNY